MEKPHGFAGADDYAVRLIESKARSLIGHYGFTDDDREDLEEDLMLDYLQRIPKFDPTRAKRSTFIARIVRNKIASIIEARKAQKRSYRTPVYSLFGWVRDKTNGYIPRIETVDADHYLLRRGRRRRREEVLDLRIDLSRATDLLTPELRDLCQRLEHQTPTEISRSTGVPRGTITDRMRKVRTVFEQRGMRDYL